MTALDGVWAEGWEYDPSKSWADYCDEVAPAASSSKRTTRDLRAQLCDLWMETVGAAYDSASTIRGWSTIEPSEGAVERTREYRVCHFFVRGLELPARKRNTHFNRSFPLFLDAIQQLVKAEQCFAKLIESNFDGALVTTAAMKRSKARVQSLEKFTRCGEGGSYSRTDVNQALALYETIVLPVLTQIQQIGKCIVPRLVRERVADHRYSFTNSLSKKLKNTKRALSSQDERIIQLMRKLLAAETEYAMALQAATPRIAKALHEKSRSRQEFLAESLAPRALEFQQPVASSSTVTEPPVQAEASSSTVSELTPVLMPEERLWGAFSELLRPHLPALSQYFSYSISDASLVLLFASYSYTPRLEVCEEFAAGKVEKRGEVELDALISSLGFAEWSFRDCILQMDDDRPSFFVEAAVRSLARENALLGYFRGVWQLQEFPELSRYASLELYALQKEYMEALQLMRALSSRMQLFYVTEREHVYSAAYRTLLELIEGNVFGKGVTLDLLVSKDGHFLYPNMGEVYTRGYLSDLVGKAEALLEQERYQDQWPALGSHSSSC